MSLRFFLTLFWWDTLTCFITKTHFVLEVMFCLDVFWYFWLNLQTIKRIRKLSHIWHAPWHASNTWPVVRLSVPHFDLWDSSPVHFWTFWCCCFRHPEKPIKKWKTNEKHLQLCNRRTMETSICWTCNRFFGERLLASDCVSIKLGECRDLPGIIWDSGYFRYFG